MGLSEAQQALLSPQPQADGTTIYPGETTLIQHEPLLDMQDPFPVLLTQALQAGGYQYPAAALPETWHAQFHDAVTGEALEEYIEPHTGKKWLCHQCQNDFVCWVKEYHAYLHPAIGVTQAEADSLAAAEVARRAAVDAERHAEVAQAAEMRGTALARTAAERAEDDRKDKEAAATAAAATARSQLQRYDIAAAQADADAAHRARRLAIAQAGEGLQAEGVRAAANTEPEASPPAAAPSAPALTHEPMVPPISEQASHMPTAVQAAAVPTLAAPAPVAVGPQSNGNSFFDRFGRSVACYTHAGGSRS